MKKNDETKRPILISIKRRLHGMRRKFFLALVFVGVFLGYFHLIGFPQWAVRKLEQNLADKEVFVSIGTVKLDFLYGLEAKSVDVYETSESIRPSLHAASVACGVHFKELILGRQFFARLRLNDARLGAAAFTPEIRALFPDPQLKSVDLIWHPGKLHILQSELRLNKLIVRAEGDLFYDKDTFGDNGDGSADSTFNWLQVVSTWMMDSLQLRDEAELNLEFVFNGILFERSWLNASLDGNRLMFRGSPFSELKMTAKFTPEKAVLDSFSMDSGMDRILLSGTYGFVDRSANLKIKNTLPVELLGQLISTNAVRHLRTQGIGMREGFQLILKTGEGNWWESRDLSGTLSAKLLEVRSVPFENVYAAFNHADSTLTISRIRAYAPARMIGVRAVDGGEVSATAQLNHAEKTYAVSGSESFDPWLISPLFEGTWLRGFLEDHEFYGSVKGQVGISGSYLDADSCEVTGSVTAGPCSRNGATVDSAHCKFAYKDSLLDLTEIQVAKDGARADASVLLNFRTKMIDVKLSGGLDPNLVAPMIHPVVARPIALFDFQGKNEFNCSGSINYGDWKTTAFAGTYSGESVRTPVAMIERASFDFGIIANELYFTNVTAQVYGGSCSGAAAFTLGDPSKNVYQANVTAIGADMTQLRDFFGDFDDKAKLGKLSGNVTLSGELGVPFEDNVRAAGSASIEEGWLVELPVLKAFTHAARMVFSSFKTFSQTDCSMDFTVSDGAVYTDNLVLAGDMMTLHGVGKYDFSDGFDVRVEMKPFRKNNLTRVVQWATTPISELLKFDLTGSASDPSWRLSRFPSFKRKEAEPDE
jgi:hypothetical protein